MVGDVRQSIYRFRNANPKLFMSKYNAYKKGDSGYAIDLAKNFRSREEVLSGINEMFSRIMDDDIGGANYLEGHVAIFGNKAYIKEGKTDQNYNLEIYNYDYDNFEDKKLYSKDEVEAFIIADDILEKIKNKEQIFDKDEKTFSDIKFKDIVILVDRKSKFELFKKIFDYKKIPLIIHKDEQFVYSNEIYVLKNLLKLIEYEKNKSYENYNYSFLSVARSYICDYNDNDIFSSVTNKDIMTNPIFQDLISKIKYLAKYSEEVSLSNLIVEIYNTFDFYSKSINIGNVANVTNKLDYIIDVCKTLEETGYNLEDFTNYFDEVFNKEIDIQFSNKKDMSSNSVNIMTIHKSKGLEYPICYFPHFYKAFNKSDLNDRFLFDQDLGIINPVFNDGLEPTIYKELMSYNYINEDISERLRVLYVALTRAKEKMIIVNPISSKNGNSLPRNDKNVVNILERQKYKCFEDIIVSLKEDLKPYITNKDINVGKAYLLKSNVDYKKLLETNDIKLETDLPNISKKAKETKTFSH
jgi:ATP-dependent helicase/nuclease subunit A